MDFLCALNGPVSENAGAPGDRQPGMEHLLPAAKTYFPRTLEGGAFSGEVAGGCTSFLRAWRTNIHFNPARAGLAGDERAIPPLAAIHPEAKPVEEEQLDMGA